MAGLLCTGTSSPRVSSRDQVRCSADRGRDHAPAAGQGLEHDVRRALGVARQDQRVAGAHPGPDLLEWSQSDQADPLPERADCRPVEGPRRGHRPRSQAGRRSGACGGSEKASRSRSPPWPPRACPRTAPSALVAAGRARPGRRPGPEAGTPRRRRRSLRIAIRSRGTPNAATASPARRVDRDDARARGRAQREADARWPAGEQVHVRAVYLDHAGTPSSRPCDRADPVGVRPRAQDHVVPAAPRPQLGRERRRIQSPPAMRRVVGRMRPRMEHRQSLDPLVARNAGSVPTGPRPAREGARAREPGDGADHLEVAQRSRGPRTAAG